MTPGGIRRLAKLLFALLGIDKDYRSGEVISSISSIFSMSRGSLSANFSA
jgi:hypothetical protein